jgi:hypothetical protein
MTLATVCRGGMLRVISALFCVSAFCPIRSVLNSRRFPGSGAGPLRPIAARSIRNGDSFISLQLKSA